MDAHVLVRPGTHVTVNVSPHCGEFCDRCGDCLRCNDDDPCGTNGGDHVWIVYSDQVGQFTKNHPDALDKKD